MILIDIYTDGGCHGNPGPGGWAFVVQRNGRAYQMKGAEANTTNNRMELTAVISALEFIENNFDHEPIRVHTDSQYVQRGMSEWMERWLKNGFKTAAKKPVKNKELWVKLNALSQRLQPQWHWVRGHSGHELNETCDSLVQAAIQELN